MIRGHWACLAQLWQSVNFADTSRTSSAQCELDGVSVMQRPQVSGPLIIAIEVGTHVVRPWNVWKFFGYRRLWMHGTKGTLRVVKLQTSFPHFFSPQTHQHTNTHLDTTTLSRRGMTSDRLLQAIYKRSEPACDKRHNNMKVLLIP